MKQMPQRAVQGVRPHADVDMLFGQLYVYAELHTVTPLIRHADHHTGTHSCTPFSLAAVLRRACSCPSRMLLCRLKPIVRAVQSEDTRHQIGSPDDRVKLYLVHLVCIVLVRSRARQVLIGQMGSLATGPARDKPGRWLIIPSSFHEQ